MKIASKSAKSFFSDQISETKYKELLSLAEQIRDFRNELSLLVFSDLQKYLNLSKFEFFNECTELNNHRETKVSSHFLYKAAEDVLDSYQNKFESVQKRLKFESIKSYKFLYYKTNNSKYGYKIGDFKEIEVRRHQTPLSKILTYLSRYGSGSTVEYLEKKAKENSQIHAEFLKSVEKFGFSRLMKLAESKRKRIFNEHRHKIEFKSLTFSGQSRLKENIISFNRNFNSEINAFANISSWSDRKKLSIPIKYSKAYHGNPKEFNYSTSSKQSYMICFVDPKQIKIVLSKDFEREVPDHKINFIGADVNCKHNLVKFYDGSEIDYNHQILDRLSLELKKIDDLKKQDPEFVPGKRKIRTVNSLRRKLRSTIQQTIAEKCKVLKNYGIDHVAMENLTGSFSKQFAKDENDLNYNRRISELQLSSIKDEFSHIGAKYGVAVSLVHSHYTSQQCPACGNIDKRNRKTQEEFECIECGHLDNADLNAAKNILNRVSSTVLRSKLLKDKFGNSGIFVPKPLRKEQIKEFLQGCQFERTNEYETKVNI